MLLSWQESDLISLNTPGGSNGVGGGDGKLGVVGVGGGVGTPIGDGDGIGVGARGIPAGGGM